MTDPAQSNRDADLWMMKRLLAVETYKQALNADEKKLYEQVSRTQKYDNATFTSTYTIPNGANSGAIKKVLQLIDLESDPAAKIVLAQEMPRNGDKLTDNMNIASARRIAQQMGVENAPGIKEILANAPVETVIPSATSLKADYVWESPEHGRYQSHPKRLDLADFDAAVKFGAQNMALYFTLPGGEKPGRHFTNTGVINDAAAIIEYLESSGGHFGLEPETLTRMFSRVARKPADQASWSGIESVADVVALLKKEPDDAYFVTPQNGGFVKLEPEDKAYDRKGQQVWPPKQKPAKGFRQDFW